MTKTRTWRESLIIKLLVWPLLLIGIAWASLALWIDGPSNPTLSAIFSITFAVGCIALLILFRPFTRAVLVSAMGLVLVVAWWSQIAPRQDRNWTPDVARLSRATIEGSRVTIENVRNFEYRSETDFTDKWETRTYDLDRLRGFDMFLSFWGPTLIAHTIASWEFDDTPPLAISIETRKEKGESYDALRGFFRQFELYYVVADERDVIGVRANQRGERMYLYRLRVPQERARALLLDYLEEINRLAEQPEWYNALIHNCTTSIRVHGQHIGEGRPWDSRILLNGRLDELGYERGRLDTSLPFPELKKRSEITEKAKAAGLSPDFSRLIREGLPDPS
ncbi:MAG: DUF4105 domain-containing protein [Nitrospira sp.]|nr:DUF4105 domain-containing protein [Nitrospira sp.]